MGKRGPRNNTDRQIQLMTHWKKLTHPDFIGAYALDDGKDMTLTIKSVTVQQVKGADGKSEECLVATWAENQKPMILNRTNCKTIEKIYKTPHIEEWSGKKVTLYVSSVKAFGEVVDALRIRPVEPVTKKPVLDATHPDIEKARAALKAGTTTIEKLRERFEIPDESCLKA